MATTATLQSGAKKTSPTKPASPAEVEAAFAEAVAEESRCALVIAVDSHPAGSVIMAKVDDPAVYSAATISRVIKKFGITVSSETIGKHRKGACRCAPEGGVLR